MCRRCGESDKRGNSRNRRATKRWMLTAEAGFGGDGEKVPCWNYGECGQMLTYGDIQADRKIPGYQCQVRGCLRMLVEHGDVTDHMFQGGSYRRSNVRPSCGPCNRGRPYAEEIREERNCIFG